MRIIKYLFFFTLIGVALLFVGFIVSQRILLYVGEQQLIRSIQSLTSASRQQIYYNQCQELNRQYGLESNSTLFQLRFIDDQEYLLETICQALPDSPNEIGRAKLPEFVTKLPGSSGIIFDDTTGQVRLTIFHDLIKQVAVIFPWLESELKLTTVITVVDGQLQRHSEYVPTHGPDTTCAGYGYRCCADVIEEGIGQQASAQDRPNRCFESCQSLPAVLAFTASPGFDQFARTIEVTSGQQVEFWTVSNSDKNMMQMLDFGDGNSYRNQSLTQPVIHTYDCRMNLCEYEAIVQLESENGVRSITSPVSTIKVKVKSN